ncbi:hypothetical protein QBC44DRAFT_354322 [Cladorrhinum sp. PSN332]|nr:hypothetical protein QBC44DRAFT_354322 [Cladorrhinum sp. PSN332]
MVSTQGISVLAEPETPTADIVLVHGFTGHPRTTWTMEKSKVKKRRGRAANKSHSKSASKVNESDEVFWPADLLPKSIPPARVLTYGYDTNIRHFTQGQISQSSVQDHARDLLCTLEAKRRSPDERSRPLVLIAHSLGGLVVKEMLRQANDCSVTHPDLHHIYTHTAAVLFFGTPHRGADPRNLLHNVLSASALGLGMRANKKVVETLLPKGIQEIGIADFVRLAHLRKWIVYSFQEEYGVSGLFGKKVVEDQSSRLDDPLETTQHISDNHMDMCRFFGTHDPGYQKVVAALEKILQRRGLMTDPTCSVLPSDSPNPFAPNEDIIRIIPAPDALPQLQVALAEEPTERPMEVKQTRCKDRINHVTTVPSNDDMPQADRETMLAREREEMERREKIKSDLVTKLQFDEMDNRLNRIITAHDNTCEWFLSTREYLLWCDDRKRPDHSGFLWIKGKPGAGKSTLMRFLLDKTLTQIPGTNSLVISFFFNARGDALSQNTIGCFRSLLLQLFKSAPNTRQALEPLVDRSSSFIKNHGWTLELLTRTFAEALILLDHDQSMHCFIDALDECDELEVQKLVSFFEQFGESTRAPKAHISICFSSRHYPSIIPKKGIEITLENQEAHKQGILRFVQAQLRIDSPKRTDEIQSRLINKSQNIFLWVEFVVPILNREYARGRLEAVEKCLDALPPGLDSLFEMILARDEENVEERDLCLQWVLFSMRPLHLHELYYAIRLGISVSPESPTDAMPKQDEIPDEDILLRYIEGASRGLTELTRSGKVQFIHQSVRDFLLKTRGETAKWPGFGEQFVGRSQELLKSLCLLSIQNYSRHLDSRRPVSHMELDLHEYALRYVLCHSNAAQMEGIYQLDFLEIFPISLWVRSWTHIGEVIRVDQIFDGELPSDTSLIYVLVVFKLRHLIRIHPSTPRHLFIAAGPYHFPIVAAALRNDVGTFLELTEAIGLKGKLNGPEVAPKLENFMRIHWSRKPRGPLVESLVEIDIAPLVEEYLRQAHENDLDSLSIVSGVIIEGGRSQSSVTSSGLDGLEKATPLFWARSEAVARVLISYGADPNQSSNHGITPTAHAAERGNCHLFDYYCSLGKVDINIASASGLRPIDYVLLFSRRRTHHEFSMISAEIRRATKSMFDALLRNPRFNPSLVNGNGESACQAILTTWESLRFSLPDSELYLGVWASIIRAYDIDLKPIGPKRWAIILHGLASIGLLEQLRCRIVERGFDPNVKDDEGASILQYVLQRLSTWDENSAGVSALKFLLSFEPLDLQARDKSKRTVFQFAVFQAGLGDRLNSPVGPGPELPLGLYKVFASVRDRLAEEDRIIIDAELKKRNERETSAEMERRNREKAESNGPAVIEKITGDLGQLSFSFGGAAQRTERFQFVSGTSWPADVWDKAKVKQERYGVTWLYSKNDRRIRMDNTR